MPYLQHPFFATRMTLRRVHGGRSDGVGGAVRKTVKQVSADAADPVHHDGDRGCPIPWRHRDSAGLLLGIFAGLAVLLAMAGVYGVMAYMVSQRLSELGLRMALGADRARIVRLVLGGGTKLAAIGLAVGFAGAWAATRLMETMLFGVERTDAATYGAMASGVAVVTLAACAVPAWRASRVDPLVALRQE